MGGISVVDWAFLAVLLISFLLGAFRGLVYEVISVSTWVAAFILAQWLAPDVAPHLPINSSQAVKYAAAFVLVFFVVVFAGALVAVVIKKLVEAVGLRPVDRALGAAFGLLRGVLLLLALTVLMAMTGLGSADWWMDSKGAEVSTAAVKRLKPVLPERFGQYLPG